MSSQQGLDAAQGRVPAHRAEARPWRQRARGGTRADRTMDRVTTQIPPTIAEIEFLPTSAMTSLSETTLQHIARADAAAGPSSEMFARFMVRSESAASSRIEHVEASAEDMARAIAGSRANSSAVSMVAASRAFQELWSQAETNGAVTIADLRSAHRLLMTEDEDMGDRRWAGTVREEQNWIGGSRFSPRDALFVPPPPELVPELLEDLERFLARDDLPILVQAGIAHAQFESIHPFTDGNGRIGRALIGALLRRRSVMSHVALPLASGLYALREQYFAALGAYRDGDLEPLFTVLCRSASAAAQESLTSIGRLGALPSDWRDEGVGRRGSAAARLIEVLVEHPTLTAEDAAELTGASLPAAYPALAALEERGILREVTGRKRDRIWVVADVVDELEDLDQRIRARLR